MDAANFYDKEEIVLPGALVVGPSWRSVPVPDLPNQCVPESQRNGQLTVANAHCAEPHSVTAGAAAALVLATCSRHFDHHGRAGT